MSSTTKTERWVAIVDDEESIRRALARLLRVHGIEARTFASARDYLSHVQIAPACLCVDLFLGEGMNGFELAEYLRGQGTAPPIIFFSGHDARELGPRVGERLQGSVILRKPVDVQHLVDLVIEQVRIGLSNEVS